MNKDIIISREKIEAFGMVESVLAIAIVAIVCLSFMSFTIASIIELYRIEQGDKLTQEAQLMAEKVRTIISNQNSSTDGGFFPPISLATNKCFDIEGDLNDPKFVAQGDDTWPSKCDYGTWTDCRCSDGSCDSAVSSTDNVYAVYCVIDYDESDSRIVKGVIRTGLIKCQRKDSSDECVVSDYDMFLYNKLNVETLINE